MDKKKCLRLLCARPGLYSEGPSVIFVGLSGTRVVLDILAGLPIIFVLGLVFPVVASLLFLILLVVLVFSLAPFRKGDGQTWPRGDRSSSESRCRCTEPGRG
ncbi:hypothetical protein SODALDRAFT_138964 [Sodiomyces alkalinus F11]|uniref:Uncharacterized protein n=1 Tax=Sodiomyces alkalinus (strain CBS 110278 / VKM F-3762 / F11) TaxID=1314773 RepID=A0A3N2PZ69_SODAK|nr:hypothetical protein SODALDRAFT_138964 [Sodiomyces alkalinus F11]ROT39829.1 hypothetical protein SODALDRAFT_138964 [Sodiomyces alkalinus F11]